MYHMASSVYACSFCNYSNPTQSSDQNEEFMYIPSVLPTPTRPLSKACGFGYAITHASGKLAAGSYSVCRAVKLPHQCATCAFHSWKLGRQSFTNSAQFFYVQMPSCKKLCDPLTPR